MKKNIDKLEEIFGAYAENALDSGAWGKAFERSLKVWFGMLDKVAKPGRVDFRRARTGYEVKTGAGEIKALFDSKLRYVVFVPVVQPEQGLLRQEGFVVDRAVFLETLDNLGLIRSKITTAGNPTVSIQTFWNHSKNKPHGAKYYALLDALYNECVMTLEDFFEADGILE